MANHYPPLHTLVLMLNRANCVCAHAAYLARNVNPPPSDHGLAHYLTAQAAIIRTHAERLQAILDSQENNP